MFFICNNLSKKQLFEGAKLFFEYWCLYVYLYSPTQMFILAYIVFFYDFISFTLLVFCTWSIHNPRGGGLIFLAPEGGYNYILTLQGKPNLNLT